MPSFASLQKKQNELVRKALEGSVFLGDVSATAIATLTTGASGALVALPSGYEDLGWLSTDGAQFSRNVDTSDVTSWGGVEPTRSDVVRDSATVQVTCQETKLKTIGLYTGADMSTVTPDATSGEVSIPKPALPSPRYYRLLTLAVDNADAGEIYVGRFLPRAKVTDFGDQKFGQGDDPIQYGVTFTAYVDSTLGYSERWLFGGPGWKALLTDMGWS